MTDKERHRYALLMVNALMQWDYPPSHLIEHLESYFTDNALEDMREKAISMIALEETVRQIHNSQL